MNLRRLYIVCLKVALGWFGDRPWMNVIKTYCGCLLGTGLSTILMPAATPYPVALIITASAFGLFVASNFSFTPTILVEIVPLDRFTTAYGLTLLCQGVGALVGPPLAGLYSSSIASCPSTSARWWWLCWGACLRCEGRGAPGMVVLRRAVRDLPSLHDSCETNTKRDIGNLSRRFNNPTFNLFPDIMVRNQ